jgi:hypothetical protein
MSSARSTRGLVVAALVGGVLFAPPAKGDGAPPGLPAVTPREAIVPEPDRMQSVQLSPDGGRISFLAPDANGVPIVSTGGRGASRSTPATPAG